LHRDLWTPLHARLHQTLNDRQLLPPEQSCLLAISGGQDSLCLLKLLIDLQPKWHWQLAVVHCDHRWRPDSAANTRHVAALAQSWALPFHLQVAAAIPTSEAQARDWRHRCYTRLAQQFAYTAVVTGHTASDRAETLLYNLYRGSGMDGLQALTWQRSLTPTVALVRPLLNFTRPETAQFCQEQQLPIWEDSTNADLSFARNRIRHEVLPYLTQHFNPQVTQALAQTAELLDQEVEYLEAIATQHRIAAMLNRSTAVNSDLVTSWASDLALQRQILISIPLAIQRRVMRQFLQIALSLQPNFDQIEKLTRLIAAPNRSRTDPFPGGVIAEVSDDLIRLVKG
jgi:tRNA(Ile)-lysidine synthase